MAVFRSISVHLCIILSFQSTSCFISPGDKSALVDFFAATNGQDRTVDSVTTEQLWKDSTGWHLDRSIHCDGCDPCNQATRWKGVGCHDPCDPFRDGPYTVTRKAYDDDNDHEHLRHTSTLRWSDTLNQYMTARPVCDKGRITSLVLVDNNLYGTIPITFGKMKNLTYVDLSNNKLKGTIPQELADIKNIEHLLLQHNDLSGTIPASLGVISSTGATARLRVVSEEKDADGNVVKTWYKRGGVAVDDDMDDSPFTEYRGLSELNLGFNQLTGTIPTELGLLDTLEYLDLSNNLLSGIVPSEISHGCPMLQVYYLQENQLTGSIPINIGTAHEEYHVNEISGSAENHPMRYIYMYNNLLNGTIPKSLGDLDFLTELKLYGNLLSGTVPPEICKMHNLRYLAMQDNDLTGSLPACIGTFDFLIYLDFYNNKLTGDMPASLADITSLQYMYLQNEAMLPLRMSFCGRRIPMYAQNSCKNDPCDTPPCKHNVQREGRLTDAWDDVLQLSDASFAKTGDMDCSRKKYNWIQVQKNYKSMMMGLCSELHSTEFTFNELPDNS